jgi:hypothetical protein
MFARRNSQYLGKCSLIVVSKWSTLANYTAPNTYVQLYQPKNAPICTDMKFTHESSILYVVQIETKFSKMNIDLDYLACSRCNGNVKFGKNSLRFVETKHVT